MDKYAELDRLILERIIAGHGTLWSMLDPGCLVSKEAQKLAELAEKKIILVRIVDHRLQALMDRGMIRHEIGSGWKIVAKKETAA